MIAEAKIGHPIGRYILFDEIAAGGMAAIHLARATGTAGFTRVFAVKRLHAQFARDTEFVAMLIDEAKLSSRIHHPSVVATLDVVADAGELFLVMAYVAGESLSKLLMEARKRSAVVELDIVAAIVVSALYGLHAAHEAADAEGRALGIVHRDVSPQNILVGVDGAAHVVDFGVAKASARAQSTRDGQVKGKISYMAPEQLRGLSVDRRADIYAAGVILWEALVGKRLFEAADVGALAHRVLEGHIPSPSLTRADVSPELDRIVMTALARAPEDRFDTALDLAIAIENATTLASPRRVSEWVEALAASALQGRAARVFEIENDKTVPGTLGSTPSSRRSDLPTSPLVTSQHTPALDGDIEQHTPERRSGVTRAAWVAAAVAVLVALVGASLRLRGPAAPSQVAVAVVDVTAPPATMRAQDLAMVVSPAGTPAPPGATANVAPPPPAAPSAQRRSRKPPAQNAVAKPRRQEDADCTDLFTVDGDGIKRFKPRCFAP